MSALKLRCFSNPSRLRQIEPLRLLAFLEPQRAFFARHELDLPPPEQAGRLDHDRLAAVLLTSGTDGPPEFFEALYFVDEMSGESQMSRLPTAAHAVGIELGDEDELTAADVAIELWLRDRSIVERLHSERSMDRTRSFDYFATREEMPPEPRQLDNVHRVALVFRFFSLSSLVGRQSWLPPRLPEMAGWKWEREGL